MVEYMLDLLNSPVELTAALVDIPSPSHQEGPIADAIEQALRALPAVEVLRHGNTVLARTNHAKPSRVVLAGHVDTVPLADNVPHRRDVNADGQEMLFGCGTVDMKSGLACYLHVFAKLSASKELAHDLTLICYEGEEVSSEYNGLGHVAAAHPEWLVGQVALLGEPSGAVIEAGCQGTIRLKVVAHGVRAHSARSWLGDNAMHKLSPVIARIAAFTGEEIEVDGCLYREGLNIVHCESGVATNTIPDEAWMYVNYRFAPHRSLDEALNLALSIIDAPEGVEVIVDDAVGGARPGLDQQAVMALVTATGGQVRAKYGWTDVSRFGDLGIPAVNYGPGDPSFAHKKDEQCPVAQITAVATNLEAFLKEK